MVAEADIHRLEQGISELKHAYEQYFHGFERLPPSKLHDELARLVRDLSSTSFANTATRFRRNNTVARYRSLSSYWQRIMRQIEEGTYKRDQRRAQALLEQVSPPDEPLSTCADDSGSVPESAAGVPPAPPVTVPQSQPTSTRVYEPIYTAYLRARQAAGIPGSVNYDKLANTLTRQAQALKVKYNCKRVAFKVSVKEGKAVIKAVPKND